MVSGSVWARPGGRQGATGGRWAGSGGRSGRVVVGPLATGGASGRRAEEGGGGGAMRSVVSREGARRCGNRGGAASVEALGVGAGAAVAPGGVEAEVTWPDAPPDAPGVRPDLLAASPGATGPRPALSAKFSPAPGAPCTSRASRASPAVPSAPSVTGGSGGGGGVAGRGGMEARRASVLMHPPFPRTGAGRRSPCGAERGRPGHAYPRGRAAIRARTSARGGSSLREASLYGLTPTEREPVRGTGASARIIPMPCGNRVHQGLRPRRGPAGARARPAPTRV